jgi:hypothetical protein
LARRDQQELSEESIQRINRVIRSLAEDRVERGIDLGRPMHCDSCDQDKPSAGSALYGVYKLCNDCLLDFTLALASGKVSSVADFMTRREEGGPMFPPDSGGQLERSASMSLNPLPKRDTLRPSNEPC